MSLGPSEIVVVLLVALVVLGPDKLPSAARAMGKYLAEFRKFSAALQAQVDEALKVTDDKPSDNTSPSEQETGPRPINPDTTGFEMIDQTRPPETPDTEVPKKDKES